MCCYKDYKNFERFNNLVQLVLHRAISFIESLPRDCQISSRNAGSLDDAMSVGIKRPMTPLTRDDDVDVDVMSIDATDGDGVTDGNAAKKTPGDTTASERAYHASIIPVLVAELTDDGPSVEEDSEPHAGEITDTEDTEHWSLEEKERLFQFIGKVFTPNFPLYFAYKHCIHSSLEDLSKQDACALNNYCELSVSIVLLCDHATNYVTVLIRLVVLTHATHAFSLPSHPQPTPTIIFSLTSNPTDDITNQTQ